MLMNFGFRREEKADGGVKRSIWGGLKRRPTYPPYTKVSDIKAAISLPVVTDEYCREVLLKHYRPGAAVDISRPAPQRPARPASPAFSTLSRPDIPKRSTSAPIITDDIPLTAPLSPKLKGSAHSTYSFRSISSFNMDSIGSKLSNNSVSVSTSDLLAFPTPPPRAQSPPSSASPPTTPARLAPLTQPSSPSTPPLVINKRKENGLYSLRSFSTTHIHTLGAKLSAATSYVAPPSPSPSPKSKSYSLTRSFSRTSVRTKALGTPEQFDRTWISSIPSTPPQLAALDIFEAFSFPLTIPVDAIPSRVPAAIPEEESESESEDSLLPLSDALGMSSHATPGASPQTGRWSRRGSLACSFYSASDSDDFLSSSSSGSSYPRCITPDLEDTPLSPWRIPAAERQKGSLNFPSRLNASASCISLGRY